MVNISIADWIFHAAGFVMLAGGAVLALWALFSDRSRGRRRCPKCWYDMAGLPGLVCPECGHDARVARRLGRTRRRRRWAATGALLAVIGYGHAMWPAVQRYGWRAIVPTTVIVAFLPRAGEEMRGVWPRQREDRFAVEMRRRVEIGGISDWQWRLALRRADIVRTRRTWPADEAVRFGVWVPTWVNGGITVASRQEPRVEFSGGMFRRSSTATVRHAEWLFRGPDYSLVSERDRMLEVMPAGRSGVPMDVEVELYSRGPLQASRWGGPPPEWAGTVELPVRVAAPGVEPMRPVESTEVTAAVRTTSSVEVLLPTRRRPAVIEVKFDREADPILDSIAVEIAAELWRGTELIATTTFPPETVAIARWWRSVLAPLKKGDFVPWDDDLSEWTIRIRGDRSRALGAYELNEYWSGSFSLLLQECIVEKEDERKDDR